MQLVLLVGLQGSGKSSFCRERFYASRERYMGPARAAGFEIVGYYFRSLVSECMARNDARAESERVPGRGLLGTAARRVAEASPVAAKA